jgi:hypothetical protein
MQKSRFGGIIIDCETDDLNKAGGFWSQALGLKRLPAVLPDDKNYVTLKTASNEPHIEVQRVSHLSRVYLDIETDNIEVEVARLEKLGANKIVNIRDRAVLEAPTGRRFCIAPVDSKILMTKRAFGSRGTKGDRACLKLF